MIGNDWDVVLQDLFNSNQYKMFINEIENEYKKNTVFPPYDKIYNALKLTPYKDVRVVIVGQDPYHDFNQANGLAFSTDCDKLPPSLKNIYKEIENEFDYKMSASGDLSKWARQGVLLLNTTLTVIAHEPLSHSKLGWNKITDYILSQVNKKKERVIFVLWGNEAKKKEMLITNPRHKILMSNHPSPLSANRGFFGNNHFKKINEILLQDGEKEIDWKI